MAFLLVSFDALTNSHTGTTAVRTGYVMLVCEGFSFMS